MLRPKLWTPPDDIAAKKHLPVQVEILQKHLYSIVQRFQCIKLASSLAVEDMILTDMIVRHHLSIQVFMLDTGELNNETIALHEVAQQHWGITIIRYQPDPATLATYLEQHGRSAMYHSVLLRRECCRIRKIEPLVRALYGADAWLTGQRRMQSVTRSQLDLEEYDDTHQLAKFNPLADWQENEVWAYARLYDLPLNKLYQQGYASIGCAACTRPVKQNEDIRAGRWWWESQHSKECGLHQ